MELGHASSRKRSPSNILHDELSSEYLPRGQKRQRSGLRGPNSDSNTFSISTNSSFIVPDSSLSNNHTEQNGNFDFFPNGLFNIPSPTPTLLFQQYFNADDHFSPHSGVDVANFTPETPVTLMMANDYFPPGSLNGQALQDAHDQLNQNLDGGSERLYAGSDDLDLRFGDDLQLNEPYGNYLLYVNSGNLGTTTLSEPALDMGNNFFSSFLESFTNRQEENEEHTFADTTFVDLNPPIQQRVFTPPLTSGNTNSTSIGLRSPTPISIKPSPPFTTRNPRLIPIKPLKEISIASASPMWHNVTSGLSSSQRSQGHGPEMRSYRKYGVRNRPLEATKAKQARDMRARGACWQCKFSKVTCSMGDPCQPCSKPGLSYRICYRLTFRDLTKKFTPDLVYGRLSESAVAKYIRDNTEFTSNTVEIEMLSGPHYPKLRLLVNRFRPLNQQTQTLNIVASEGNKESQCFKFVTSYAPPFGLEGSAIGGLRSICQDHIKSIIERERHQGEANEGDISIISWKVFESINKYRRLNGGNDYSRLLKKAVMLHAMHYFLSRIITFDKESAERAIEGLPRPHMLKFAPALSSILLNLQIKRAMYRLLSETTYSVLDEFEIVFSKAKGKPGSWVDIFCVVLVLCMCIEAVQVASDSYATAGIRKDPTCKWSRDEIYRDLDECVFRRLTDLFHMAYKTPKASGKGRFGFNPIRNRISVNGEDDITPQMVRFVREIKQIMEDHGDEMVRIAEDPSFNASPDLLTDHMAFRKRNSGRLVSKFLRSFVQDS